MKNIKISKRFNLFTYFISSFLLLSFIIRIILYSWVINEADTSLLAIIRTFITGAFFDIGTISFFAILYAIYLTICPNKLVGTLIDKIITYFSLSLCLFIQLFSFLAEITFWEEFQRRFNFIAVDYLIYTNEVLENINESYPIPILIAFLFILIGTTIFIYIKAHVFKKTFNNHATPKQKFAILGITCFINLFFIFFIKNEQAEWSGNRDNNELSKAGIYSFFSAFRNNELSYTDFYKSINTEDAFTKAREQFSYNKHLDKNKHSIQRLIINNDSLEIKPNVICFCVESLSGSFLSSFGNKKDLTPTLDSLAQNSLFLTNLFANGTRTVRAMEALTLSVPPTPGRSIVKRKDNQNLYTIGEIFKQKGYTRNFFYGGDGYFDNMNSYFGGNGFNIVDKGKRFLIDKKINTKRTIIQDNETTFENAWGVCDGDLFNKLIKETDKAYSNHQKTFDFVMTTSNHRPYTYPDNAINIPSGTGRDGAVRYTDYAFKQFFATAKTKPWFKNTIFIIVADHCASSAGKWDLDIKNYHIPAMIINLESVSNIKNQKVNKLCSQIDIFPTLFGLFNWSYTSNFFGKDVMKMHPTEQRAFVGNYRKLGLMKNDTVIVLNDKKEADSFEWNKSNNDLSMLQEDTTLTKEAISWYQIADYLYRNGGLKTENITTFEHN